MFLCTDDEFEEVPEKEGYEPVIPSHLRAEYGEYSLGGYLLDESNLLIVNDISVKINCKHVFTIRTYECYQHHI